MKIHRACRLVLLALVLALILEKAASAQEASSGFDLRTTVSGEAFYSHELSQGPLNGGVQAILYPAWKLNSHWAISAAVQLHSTPYFPEEFYTPGYQAKSQLLQLSLSYARFWRNRSLQVRIGDMPSSFGNFVLRYDPVDNPLVGAPQAYGYYYKPVSIAGLPGAQIDATVGKLDLRAQIANSSPVNPRSVFDHDQYANWAGGAGYTIRQGFRVGGSAYYGPYLDRHYPYFFPGEANPRNLPAMAYGVDVQWGHGPWNAWGEWQHFRFDYKLIPVFSEHTGYAEIRRVLTPRWYAAVRAGYLQPGGYPGEQSYEVVAGFRPNRYQILKAGYQMEKGPAHPGTLDNTATIQLVTSFHVISFSKN